MINILLRIKNFIVKFSGFWGFGEQYVTVLRILLVQLRIADIYTPGASIDNGVRGSGSEPFPAMTCLLIALLKVDRAAIGHNQLRRSIIVWLWRMGRGVWIWVHHTPCSAPKNCFSCLP